MAAPTALQLAQELIRLRSINPPGEEQACAELTGKLLSDAGYRVTYHQYADGRLNLVAELSGTGDEKPLCFTGHLDTVPLGAAPWSRDPFAADIVGDRLYGRGSSDMKSGVAAMVRAAIDLAKTSARPQAGLVLVLTVGEETGCDGARALTGIAGALPKAGALVVGEPTGNQPLIGHKGALWLRASFKGVTAHGSMPEQGDNAVYKAARGVLRLSEHAFDAPRHHHLGGPSLNVGTFNGGLNVNSVPDRAEIQLDVRTIPGQSNETITRELGALLGDGAEISRIVDVGAVASSPQNQWISEVFDLCERLTGNRIDPKGAPFFTDASVLVPAMDNMPALILGPGETVMAHKTDEYCLVSKIEAAVELYAEIGRRWMGI
ncbi:M20 family metallopeptidase [Dongia soli]|uniref:Probable succinyl-diaminopimelate desuccinylase n=1 Tax=Dongia soli TaxID=600628 RepID=A0ABU5EHG5_9PROT|nr:M20 family metallopeptidase [Dongia soli]MDY0885454.1 M20 family metallopeptidase [Dongia soli]